MPLLALKKKVGYGISWNRARKLKRISELAAQIRFNRGRLIVIVVRRSGNLFGQRYYARVHRRQLQIVQKDLGGIIGRGSTQLAGPRLGNVGRRLIAAYRMLGVEIKNRVSIVHRHQTVIPLQQPGGWRKEENVADKRLHQRAIVNWLRRPG